MSDITKIFRRLLDKLRNGTHKKSYVKPKTYQSLAESSKGLQAKDVDNGSKENTEMDNMEELSMAAMQIISNVGTARSSYIEAIQEAKKGNYENAEAIIKEGDEAFAEGHDAHLKLLQQEAEGKQVVMLLILHAEDQLMSAEGFKIIATELIDVYKRLNKLQK